MGLENSKRYSYSFHQISAKLYEDIGCHGGIQAITSLGNRPSSKMLWHFEISTWENCKMCNILKTAHRRVKRMKIWDSQSSILHT